MTKQSQQQGFTLLEVLIAIGIFTIIGVGSYQLLNSIFTTQDHTQSQSQEMRQLQRALQTLAMDLEQSTYRSIRDEFGDFQHALLLNEGMYMLEITRRGWLNPLQHPRSKLQRVAYDFDGSTLQRYYWMVLDRDRDSEPRSQVLLDNIESLDIRILDSQENWYDQWPPLELNDGGEVQAGNPVAIEVTVNSKKFGKLRRVHSLAMLPHTSMTLTDRESAELSTGSGDES
ncbi:type II secretion system minor pseudopilin GspJ [Desulfurispira natronophila]|uniref:Type II secretion system protein J n=1 Tax=Desulfurispira natronophila TaxID=682562 RepID=A0A7W7Y2I9_9BACT|nr:type II secretion system minor pseudopilin GspJ [Desulfurispira natronophila]MBB5020891.1 general secretion pathway protein J [Desulfurispira natronophila]